MDQLHLQVGAHPGQVGAGEVAAVVDVQGGRQPAHRPSRVGFAPDGLPQGQCGLQRGRSPEEHRVPGDPGPVVQDDGQPRPGRAPGGVQHYHVELGVVGLPDVVGVRRFSAQHQLEVIPVHVRTVVCYREQSSVKSLHVPAD